MYFLCQYVSKNGLRKQIPAEKEVFSFLPLFFKDCASTTNPVRKRRIVIDKQKNDEV